MAQWGPQMHCGFQGPPNFKVETQWRTCASKIKAQHYFTSNTLWRKEISSPPWKPSHSHNRQKPDKSTQPSDLDSFRIIHFLLCPDILGWSTNSQPFSLFGSDLDQVQNSGPYWSHCRVWKCLLRAILVQRGNCYLHHSINFCCWKILVWPPSISAAFPRIRVRESRWNRCLVATLLSLSWTQHPGLFSAQLLLPL